MGGFGSAVGLEGRGGRVGADGTLYGTRAGWTCTIPSLGHYVITHNMHLDPTKYLILLTAAADPATPLMPPTISLILTVFNETSDSFEVTVVDGNATNPVNASFNFGLLYT